MMWSGFVENSDKDVAEPISRRNYSARGGKAEPGIDALLPRDFKH